MTTYEHFVYANDEASATRMAADLQTLGAIVPDAPRAPDEPFGEWLVMAYTGYTWVEDPTGWYALCESIRQVAAKHGGFSDGGGMHIGSLPGSEG